MKTLLKPDDPICEECLAKHGLDRRKTLHSTSWWDGRCRACGKLRLCSKLADFAKEIAGRPLEIRVDEEGDICLAPPQAVEITRASKDTRDMNRAMEAARIDQALGRLEFVVSRVEVCRHEHTGEFIRYKVEFVGHPHFNGVWVTAHFTGEAPDMLKIWTWDDIKTDATSLANRAVWVNHQRYLSPAGGRRK